MFDARIAAVIVVCIADGMPPAVIAGRKRWRIDLHELDERLQSAR
jgi:hypothetical protein